MRFDLLRDRVAVLLKAFGFLALCLSLVGMTSGTAQAQTRVTRDGECAVTIIVPLELRAKTPVNAAKIKEIKEQIEEAWNAPTRELVEHMAETADDVIHAKTAAGQPAQFDYGDHFRLNRHYKNFIEMMGANPNCATVNCCQICIKVDIKLRLNDAAPATPGYHQIELMPNKVDGKWFRSFVRRNPDNPNPQEATATGQWNAYDESGPPFAHEVGHLMGLRDQYKDVTDENGDTHSVTNPGHENDIMAHDQTWPTEDGFKQILQLAKIDISNCCKDPKPVIEVFNRNNSDANNAIDRCNPDDINRELLALRTEEKQIYAETIALEVKYDLINRIHLQIANLQLALENCPSPRIVEITNQTLKLGLDAAGSCNRDVVQEVMLKLDVERARIAADDHIAILDKNDILTAIDKMKERLEKALRDCPPAETITVGVGFEGGIWCTYGFGVPIPVNIMRSDDVPTPVDQPKLPPYEVFKPQTPDRPTTPDQPRTPDQPKTPVVEKTPDVPTQVEQPNSPPNEVFKPTTPVEQPKVPETPKTPVAEKTPEKPNTPDTPKTPDTPQIPDQPQTPANNSPPPPQIPDTIFVKASEQVLEGGQTGQPLDGQNIKLFAPNKPDLPGNGGTRTAQDTGFNKDPAQCKTGADGTCQITIDGDEKPTYRLGLGLDYGHHHNWRLDYDLPRHDGGVSEVPKTTTRPGTPPVTQPDLPPGATATNNTFNIGDRTFIRLGFTFPYGGPNVNLLPLYTPFFPNFETDFCRDKQPGPPLDMQPVSLSAFNNELPSVTVKLDASDRRARSKRSPKTWSSHAG